MKTIPFKHIMILTGVILLFTQCNWVKQAGNLTGTDNGFQIVTDSLDNCYVTGKFTGKAVFGDTIITSINAEDCYIAKYNKNGNFIWVKTFGGKGSQCGNSVAIQPNGDVLLAGNFWSELVINDTIIKSGWSSIFIVKLNNLGQIKWYKTYGNGMFNDVSKIKSDKDNNIIAVGRISNTISVGNKSMISHGQVDGFILKLDNAGNPIWSHVIGGKDDDEIRNVSIDCHENIYISGECQYNVSIDNDSLTTTDYSPSYIAKFSKSGKLMIFKTFGEERLSETLDIVNDNVGNLYITGYHSGPIKIDNKEFPASPETNYDIFIAKFNDKAELIWFNQHFSSTNGYGNSITIDKKNNCYLTGTFNYDIEINGKRVKANSGENSIVLKYNSDGKLKKYKIFSGTGDVEFWSSCVSKTSNDIFSTGCFTKYFELNNENKIYSKKGKDILIMKTSNDIWNF